MLLRRFSVWHMLGFSVLAVLVFLVVLKFSGVWVAAFMACAAFIAGMLYHAVQQRQLARWLADERHVPHAFAGGLWQQLFDQLQVQQLARARKENMLLQTLERFHKASQAMPDGLIYLDDEDRIEWLNDKAEYLFGLNRGTDTGLTLTSLVRHAGLGHYLAQPGQEPLLLTSPRKAEIYLSLQVIPFDVGQRLLIARDMTVINNLEHMRRDFVANVSHELRTPLTVVNGFIETVMDDAAYLDAAQIREYLQLAHDQASRMQRLIADLLTLSTLETTETQTEEEIPLAPLLTQLEQEAQQLSGGYHRIHLTLPESSSQEHLHGSGRELHSAFANLVSNAIRYTPEGGEIALEWRRMEDGRGEFAVTDSGIGIEPQYINRLTERFFRVDRSRSRETGGTGLGLAIVKHIVVRHQGALLISSTPGTGSRFAIRLPATRILPP